MGSGQEQKAKVKQNLEESASQRGCSVTEMFNGIVAFTGTF